MKRSRRAPFVAGAAAAFVLLAACGSDKSDVPTTTEAPSTTAAAAATTTVAATTTTATTVVLIHVGDACGVYGAAQKVGDTTLYCDGEKWGSTPPPSTTAAPTG